MENEAKYKIRGNVLYVLMPEEVDHHSSDELKTAIAEARGKQAIRNLVFDFKETVFMDSAGTVSYTHLGRAGAVR